MTNNNKQRIGVMGGTFDPIHYGHLVAAESARQQFELEKVIFIPAGNPPHKKDYNVTDVEHRYLMTVLATAHNPYFTVSRMEIERKGPSYTIDTIRDLKMKLGPETELYFITGADAILDILSWKESNVLIQLCKFIAATRPGYCLSKLDDVMKELGQADWQERGIVYLMEIPEISISSTEIREKVRLGRSITYMVPELVELYIMQNRLYLTNT